MTQVIFYQLSEPASPADNNQSLTPAADLQAFACYLAAHCYRNKQRVSVLCADQAQAHAFDELLWQLPPDSFIAHNLANEGPKGGALVEITWPKQTALRSIVINLATTTIPDPNRYQLIYDFVPVDEQLKDAARERFKQCKLAGCQMQFAKATDLLAQV